MPRKNKQVVLDLSEWAKSIGAVLDESYHRPAYIVETRIGKLWFSPDADTYVGGASIFARFDDVAAARKEFGVGPHDLGKRLNPFSGKWNWHEALGHPDQSATDQMAAQFMIAVAGLLR